MEINAHRKGNNVSTRAMENRFEGKELDPVNGTELVLGGCKVRLHFTEEPNKHAKMAVLTSLLYSAERQIREKIGGDDCHETGILPLPRVNEATSEQS